MENIGNNNIIENIDSINSDLDIRLNVYSTITQIINTQVEITQQSFEFDDSIYIKPKPMYGTPVKVKI